MNHIVQQRLLILGIIFLTNLERTKTQMENPQL